MGLKEPALQTAQAALPGSADVPAGQGAHTEPEVAPTTVLAVPPGHRVQLEAPSEENVPATQAVQFPLPIAPAALLAVPAVQLSQLP